MSIIQLKAPTEQTNKTGTRDGMTEKGAEDLLGLICSKLGAESLRWVPLDDGEDPLDDPEHSVGAPLCPTRSNASNSRRSSSESS